MAYDDDHTLFIYRSNFISGFVSLCSSFFGISWQNKKFSGSQYYYLKTFSQTKNLPKPANTLHPQIRIWYLGILPCKISTVWNVSKYGVFSSPYFPAFGLNAGKYGPEKTPQLDTFHAVLISIALLVLKISKVIKSTTFPWNFAKNKPDVNRVK